MLPRVPEPEAMDDEQEVAEYNTMQHSAVNLAFVQDLLAVHPAVAAGSTVVDLGTGTALIPLLLLEHRPDLQIIATDKSPAMLRQAERNLQLAVQPDAVQLLEDDSCQLSLPDHFADVVISNSLIHHLPEPAACFREAVRILQPGGFLFIRDLFRPETTETVEHLVATHAAGESLLQQQLLRQSLHAALIVSEVEALLKEIPGLNFSIAPTSDRHWTLTGWKQTT